MHKNLSLKDIFNNNKGRIVQEILKNVQNAPPSSYFQFLQTGEGGRRLRVWVDLMIRSLEDAEEKRAFFIDIERVGYSRAIQGFKIADVLQIYDVFQKVFLQTLEEAVAQKRIHLPNLYEHISEISQILLQCIIITSVSYLKTREEMIAKNVSYFQTLYDFTHELISSLNLDEVANLILKKIFILIIFGFTIMMFLNLI